ATRHVAIRLIAAIVRADFARKNRPSSPGSAPSVGLRRTNVHYTRIRAKRPVRRRFEHSRAVHAADFDHSDHVFSDPAAAAAKGEATPGDGQSVKARRHRRNQWWTCGQGDEGGGRRLYRDRDF